MGDFHKRMAGGAGALLLCACASVTMRPLEGPRISGEPDYQSRKAYFWWGLQGEHEIDVAAICQGKPVAQAQSLFTPGDVGLAIVTLGIYQPKTAKVWCAREAAE